MWPEQEPLMSVSEYLQAESDGETRHEYIGGRIYAMTGASVAHNLIAGNLFVAMRPLARQQGCQVFFADLKVRLKVAGEDIFYYPDLMLCCKREETDYYRTRPRLIVEILSKTTERIDRREKLLSYATIPSLRDYLLVAQDRRDVIHHRRSNAWIAERVSDGALNLECLDGAVGLDEIYEDVGLRG